MVFYVYLNCSQHDSRIVQDHGHGDVFVDARDQEGAMLQIDVKPIKNARAVKLLHVPDNLRCVFRCFVSFMSSVSVSDS